MELEIRTNAQTVALKMKYSGIKYVVCMLETKNTDEIKWQIWKEQS